MPMSECVRVCNHVNHNQLESLYHLKSNFQYCGFVVGHALCGFKTSTVFMYTVINGKEGLVAVQWTQFVSIRF